MRLEFLAPIITCLFIWLIYLTHIKNKKWLKLVFIGLTSITIVYTIIEINKEQKEIDNTRPTYIWSEKTKNGNVYWVHYNEFGNYMTDANHFFKWKENGVEVKIVN